MPSLTQPVEAIPLPQVADRAEILDRLLQEIRHELTSNSELIDATQRSAQETGDIETRTIQTKELLMGAPTSLELEDEQRYWRVRSSEYQTQRKLLTGQAAKLEAQLQLLDSQQEQWQATWNQIHQARGIQAVIDRVRQELDRIREVRSQTQEQLSRILDLQNRVSRLDQEIYDVLQLIRQSRAESRRRLFQTDALPLWELHQLRQLDQTRGEMFPPSFDHSYATAEEFLQAHKVATFAVIVCYFLALIGIFKLQRSLARAPPQEISAEALFVLKRPFSVALLMILLGTGQHTNSAPISIAFVLYLLLLIPMLRLLIPLVEPKLKTYLYVLSAFFMVEGLYLLVRLPPLLRRELSALIILGALISVGWLVRPLSFGSLAALTLRERIFAVGIRASLSFLAASLLANIVGFVSLAQVLGLTALLSPFIGATLYCGAYVLILILKVVLRTAWARDFLEIPTQVIERWGVRLLAITAGLFWLKALLHLLTIHEGAMVAISELLQYRIGFERVHFTLGGMLGIMLILLCGYAFARACKFLLTKVVLPRLPLQRGLPYAISTVTYYVLLFSVAVAALSTAGVELNKFTVLTGALGVGLGFGLQNIVNNFVSGVILLFERPIHVGDTVDIGGLTGVVRRIGARSSTIVTFQGAEVIVPNNNLLSNQVVNWTLSSQLRRVDIPVGVAHGTDPERVIAVLLEVAKANPGVFLERPPAAFFLGFGESALNFELRFWSADQNAWFQLQSDVAIAVAKALRLQGIQIATPQRELHLRTAGVVAAETVALSVATGAKPSGRH